MPAESSDTSSISDGDVPNGQYFVELRTHGVSGTPPESILGGDVRVVKYVGDKNANFWRRTRHLDSARYADVGLTEWSPEDPSPGRRPVIVEAYRWGNITSGTTKKALWALLFPFAVTNLAAWMIPPKQTPNVAPSPTPDAGTPTGASVAFIRVFGVLLTSLLVIQSAVAVVDILAAQCISSQPGQCMQKLSWTSGTVNHLSDHPLVLALVIGVLLASLVGFAGFLTKVPPAVASSTSTVSLGPNGAAQTDGGAESATDPPPAQPSRAGLGEQSFVDGDDSRVAALRTIHVVAAFAASVLLLSADSRDVLRDPWWWTGVALASLAIVGALGLSRGTGFLCTSVVACLGGKRRGFAISGVVLVVWMAFSWFVITRHLDEVMPGQPILGRQGGWVLNSLMVALAACAFLVFVCLGPRIGRFEDAPSAFRPWLRGTASAFVLGFAAMLGSGFGVALGLILQSSLSDMSTDGFTAATLPWIYDSVAVFWGVIAVISSIGAIGAWWWSRWRFRKSDRFTVNRCIQHGSRRADVDKSEVSVWLRALAKAHLHVLVCAIVLTGVVAMAISLFFHDRMWPWAAQGLKFFGTALLVAAVGALLAAVYTAARKPRLHGRSLGVIWDLVSFWPREAHPVVPGEYAPRAVNDLLARIRHYAKDDNARIVLCGHSQGSVVMYSVILQLLRQEPALLTRIGLITYGSPLQWAYTRGFPSMLSYESHRAVGSKLGGGWYNLIRSTDPIGGPVFTWNYKATRDPEGTVMTMSADCCPALTDDPTNPWPGPGTTSSGIPTVEFQAVDGPADAAGPRVVGGEYWLTDPQVGDVTDARLLHSNYFADSVWPRVLAAVATALEQSGSVRASRTT